MSSSIMHTAYEQRQMNDAFDVSAAMIRDVLTDPELQEQLGGFAAGLALAADELFLPNIRDGVVSLPDSKRDSNGFALVPVETLRSDKPLFYLDSTMLDQTPRRYELNGIALGTEPQPVPVLGVNGRDTLATVHTVSATDPHYVSRPVICIDSRIIQDERFQPVAPMHVGHEMQHAVECESSETSISLPTISDVVEFELPAFYVGAQIFAHMHHRLELCDIDLQTTVQDSLLVESIRKHEEDPNQPFASNPALERLLTFLGYSTIEAG